MNDIVKTARSELVMELYVAAFGTERTPRSDAYKHGVKAALQRIFDGADVTPITYAPGTSEFDAFIAGRLEGHMIASEHMATCKVWGVGA